MTQLEVVNGGGSDIQVLCVFFCSADLEGKLWQEHRFYLKMSSDFKTFSAEVWI